MMDMIFVGERFSNLYLRLSALLLQLRMRIAYLAIIILILYPYVECDFFGRSAGYTEVPHSLINTNETKIDLSFNAISVLRDAEFSQYGDLKSLAINHGILSDIHGEAFLATNINTLSFGGNELREFPNVTCIAGTLTTLYVWRNKIQRIPPNLLSPLLHLRILHVYENSILHLTPKMFVNNSKLGLLHLYHNRINEVPVDAFAGLSNVHTLFLGANNISEFSARVLEPLTSLRELGLIGIPFTVWPDPALVPGVHDLTLRVDSIEKYLLTPYHVPQSVCKVDIVSIGEVSNGELPSFDCPQNESTTLSSLGLHNRQLNDFADFSRIQSVSPSANLKYLTLKGNLFTAFPSIPHNIREGLMHLLLDSCKIASIDPSALEGYSMLYRLDLSGNQLVTLPSELFKIANLLYLSNMPSLDFNQSTWEEHLCEASGGKLTNLYLDRSMAMIQQFPDISHLACSKAEELSQLTISLRQVNHFKWLLHMCT